MSRSFAIGNVLLSAVWLSIYFLIAPSRSAAVQTCFVVAWGLFALGGVGWWRGGRLGRTLALVGAVAALAFAIVLLTGLVAAAAYLHAIFGAMGQAASAMSAFSAALVVVGMGLLPAVEIVRLQRDR